MLKKRILASSMASVMALSSVSVVAFADETATDFGEVVTKAELKEHLKTYESLIKGDINNYGSVQALRFQEAYDHAAYVAADAEASKADITAAYQMVKAVYETLEQYTNEQLKELIAENKATYETNNILNAEILDNIYKETPWIAFKNAYEDAEVIVNVDDLMMVTDAYITLAEAAKTLEANRLTPVSKTDYRNVIREYEEMLAKFSKNETWRRGTVSKKPTSGGSGLDLTSAAYVTWGELQNIVYGASNTPVVTAVTARTNTTAGTDTTMAPAGKSWIKVSGGSVENLIYTQSKNFDDFKSAVKTTDPNIKGAYDAAKEAIAVFNSWKAIDADVSVKSEATKTLNNYRIKLANDFEKTLINSLVTTNSSDFGGTLTITNGSTSALVYDGKTLKGNTGVNAKECYLRIDSGTGLIQLDGGNYKHDEGTTKSYTIRIAEGVDYMKYIPVRAANVVATSGNGFETDSTEKKIEKVQDALFMLEKYTATAANSAATADDWKAAYEAEQTASSTTVADSVNELDENTTITKPSGSSREYTLINRYLTYALTDLYPSESKDCKHTKAEVKALIIKAYDLINKTGSSNIFAEANDKLANARKDAVEWVREAEKDKLYKDNDGDHGKFDLGTQGKKTATDVYHSLSCKGDAGLTYSDTYDKLQDLLNKYPISYGEIVEKIADVNQKFEDKVYGDKVKAAVDDVAYCMSVLKASNPGNEAFTDERALNAYNRLRSDIKSADIDATEVALVKALTALDTAIADAEKEPTKPETVPGDLDGDNIATSKDALMIVQYTVGLITLTDDQKAAADFDGDGNVTSKDALAIVKAALGLN